LQRKYADRPRDELIALYLMALEDKELVTVGYREDLINRRLESMPLSEHFLGDQFCFGDLGGTGYCWIGCPARFFSERFEHFCHAAIGCRRQCETIYGNASSSAK